MPQNCFAAITAIYRRAWFRWQISIARLLYSKRN